MHTYCVSEDPDRRIQINEEVFLSYGDLSDGELLSIYGFIGSNEQERNPHANVALEFDNIVECCNSTAEHEVNMKAARGHKLDREPIAVPLLLHCLQMSNNSL